MASTSLNIGGSVPAAKSVVNDFGHRWRLRFAWLLAMSTVVALSVYGFSYYRLSREDRPLSPLDQFLRPSGTIGVRLGILGLILYGILFLYPIRKRVKWLAKIGKTKHWLDFHVLVGVTAPLLITFHASFKLSGIAGVSYWIMMAVALSGFVGRYIYAQIPRSLNQVELSMSELEDQAADLTAQLARQSTFSTEDLSALLRVPGKEEVSKMPLAAMIWTLLRMDLARPLFVARLRRNALHGAGLVTTLGGLFASKHDDLEAIIATVRKQAGLRSKMAFLERTEQVFHLWHVVHRPFSYSFAVLVVMHVTVVILMGYY
jgi:hypothetical protein